MSYDLVNGWFYSVTIKPFKNEKILRIYFKKELKHQQEIDYIPGDASINNIIKKIKKGSK